MDVVETATGKACPVVVLPIENKDLKLVTKGRYFFDWNKEKGYEIYKLMLKGMNDILGLVSIERIPLEARIHIRLITVSRENKGKDKKYDKIAGNLIVYIAKIAVAEFGELACISLTPKTQIAGHYIDKYKMNVTGLVLSMEVPEILDLINEYDGW
jgi:hypothetical protein